ncbi:WD40-repeat-containing domain protein [Zychaea mexicana]|uniref:WD40-repeat-containing domain protein n=1 Tax=Zychaea mexicana TaxID=64656 RepID=UPI0022FF3C78|nr:WD40-repeat-containing domain protein [Zychaea mexicana]KAI9488386.1 WD40-repeat-containing domain protein [Zychaea mexicana]
MSEHSEQDIVIDGDAPSPTKATITTEATPPVADEYKDMDEIDTDDLLSEAEITLKQPKKTTSKRKAKTAANGTSTSTTTRRSTRKSSTTTANDNDDNDEGNTTTTKRKSTRKGKQVLIPPPASLQKQEKPKKKKPAGYDPERCKQLTHAYPDTYWQFHADTGYSMINTINDNASLESVPCNISDQAAITSMTLSADGTLLATFSNIGAVKIWDVENDFKLVRKLRDVEEPNIDEFYCGKFASPTSQELLVTGGKLKDRHRWSSQDEDNHILPCPIKIFSIAENKVLAKLEGHSEEILCIKSVTFDKGNYYISTSQDGYIIKWHVADDWTTLIESTTMEDGVTCMAFTVSFLPNTGNKYFMAACDEHLRLYDFEEAQLLQTFEDMYSSYCDCGKFITWLDEGAAGTPSGEAEGVKKEEDINVDKMDEDPAAPYSYFISRGAEMCDVDDGVSSIPNTCTLHKLVYPTEPAGKFKLESVKKFKHEDYHANSWLVKITSNGRYILAPTIYGQIFVFNILSGQLAAILKEHEDLEVRDVIFHPYRPLIFSSGDDGFVKVYTYKSLEEEEEADLDVGMSSS